MNFDIKNFFLNIISFAVNPSDNAAFYINLCQNSNIFLYKILRMKLIKSYSIDFSRGCKIGKGLKVPHPIGIVFGSGCVLGDNVTVYQNVTIGAKNGKYPKIGDNVIIYPGSVLVGEIFVGDNCVIGAMTFLDKSLDNGVVFNGKS